MRADDAAVTASRVGPILDPNAGPVGAPKNVALRVSAFARQKGPVDRALFLRVRRPVRPPVMDQGVHVLADDLARVRVAEQADAGGVAKGAPTREVEPADRLGRRIQEAVPLL